MTCKECVHYEVCGKGVEGSMDRDQLHFESRFPRKEKFDCPDFKPKSRFVELPCEVGQECYFVYETDNETMFIVKGKVQCFAVDDFGIWIRAIYENLSSYWHPALIIGDTVFLSREEAEKALAERSK